MNVVVLDCQNLSRWHGPVIALNNLNVMVGTGITGLLGPNGSGKSTLLKLSAGLLRPSAGHVRTLDQDPWGNPALQRQIGYLPEGPAPWRERTGKDAIQLAARLSGLSAADAAMRTRAVVEELHLETMADRRVGTYSHGYQQRLKLAVATVHEPQLLILDEPLLGTDPLVRQQLLDHMRRWVGQDRSIILSTHVLADVEALTRDILVLHHGRLLAHGTVETVRELLDQHPRTVRIATPQPDRLGRALWGWPEVHSMESNEGALLVRVKDPSTFHRRLQSLLIDEGIPFSGIVPLDESVAAVFDYLVGARK